LRYLITGGAGFIGSHLTDALVARGDKVVVLDDLSTGRLENIEHLVRSNVVDFVEGSMLDEDLMDDCMQSVDACFHLASAVGVQLIVQRPLDSLLRNIRGNDIVISTAARHRRRVLFTSTSEVYGKASVKNGANGGSGALTEESDRVLGSPFKSRWAYATAKAFGEALCYSYYREQRFPMVVTRLFNTVGPRQTGAYGMVVPRFVRQALAGDDLTVYGNGTQSRCFVHVADTVNALLLLADSELAVGNVYNVGADLETPIVELARRVIERVGSSSKIQLIPYEKAYEHGFEELGRRQPDTTAIRNLTGWQATRTIDDAIEDVIAHEQAEMTAGRKAAVAR
jgi:UDP-glucose 4-epimerase